jgi:sugar phosphate isomerase/epimerase
LGSHQRVTHGEAGVESSFAHPAGRAAGAGRTIAGFGFCTEVARPDLSDLDAQLARIEATGASHCELSLHALDLIVGGRVLAERRRRLEQICARRSLCYTVHGVLAVNFMDEIQLELHKAVCRATLELCDAVGASVMAHHPGRPATASRSRSRTCSSRMPRATPPTRCAWPARSPRSTIRTCAACSTSAHAYIMARFRGQDYLETLEAFAPCVNHLHVHDSFGRPTSIEGFYRPAEQIAFGMGDLHLPMGWGDIPWDAILPRLRLRAGTVMIVELLERYWAELDQCAAAARRFMDMINGAQARAA